jgi:membrane-associated phospholipid phosphatase
MPVKLYAYKASWSWVITLCLTKASLAQSWQDHWLQKIHVERNVSHQSFYKAVSNTIGWVAIAEVTGQLVVGYGTKDNTQIKNGYTSLAALVSAYAITTVTKKIIKRERPYVGNTSFTPYAILNDYSFPSGHAGVSFATAGNLAFQYKKWYVIVPAYAWATTVAYSRMYLGVHYPSDVLVGALIGTGTAYIAHKLQRNVFEKKYPKKLLYK